YPYHTARKSGRTCANGEAIEIEVGFLVRGRFLELFRICHDEFSERTHYVVHSMHPGNDGYQRSFPRPSWLSSGFFNGKNVDRLYTNVNQKAMVAQILGSDELAEKFIQPVDTEIYLARGHLAAKVDFIYGAQQRATFWLMNVAPQWQKFNGGNWERVESSVRRMVSARNTQLEIYTGTYGIMTLPDMNGENHEIFLHFDENNNGQIPVPKLYYRVLYERSTRRGIVIVGVNNIHITVDEMIDQNYILCEDVADKIDWINWDRFNVNVGYSYACDYSEFASIVGHLPHLEVDGFQRGFPRPPFIQYDHFPTDLNVNLMYTRNRQRQTIAGILGDQGLADDLIHPTNDYFMARGHLAARADFIFGNHQRASFYFINAAPQWQTFNGGNWERIEDGVRNFVADRNIEVEVFTGTWDILHKRDINGNFQPLFLVPDNNNPRIPVPKFYYKVVYEPRTTSAIVFIGVNNPYATWQEINNEYIICNDIGNQVNWINWDRDRLSLGFSYACHWNDFIRVVDHLPNLRVTQLLI
uniref:DNA/RNA non-specific endonuclease domain-containing protein n=1 Tax=Phlebotomus papatasi TaxID=29031 RepID=A0A1B0D5G0_PHLPP